MAHGIGVGIIGGGWPGVAHARGYRAAGGFTIRAVADLIPARRAALAAEGGEAGEGVKTYATAEELLADAAVEAVSLCLPTHLHLPITLAALKAKKHVMLETPPALSSREAQKLAKAASKRQRVLAYAFQRRFGAAELAGRQVIEKGYLGDSQHVRASWMRTRGIPAGTGWYTDRAQSGGGALLDLGLPLLDLAWHLLGRPRPLSAFAITHQYMGDAAAAGKVFDVEGLGLALVRFADGKSLELAASWAINQAPSQNGTTCRVYGSTGGLEIYTPQGPLLYRHFDASGAAKQTPLKLPKVSGHAALLRQFRQSILGKAPPAAGGAQAVFLMQMMEALYKSAASGKSVSLEHLRPTDDNEQTLAAVNGAADEREEHA